MKEVPLTVCFFGGLSGWTFLYFWTQKNFGNILVGQTNHIQGPNSKVVWPQPHLPHLQQLWHRLSQALVAWQQPLILSPPEQPLELLLSPRSPLKILGGHWDPLTTPSRAVLKAQSLFHLRSQVRFCLHATILSLRVNLLALGLQPEASSPWPVSPRRACTPHHQAGVEKEEVKHHLLSRLCSSLWVVCGCV